MSVKSRGREALAKEENGSLLEPQSKTELGMLGKGTSLDALGNTVHGFSCETPRTVAYFCIWDCYSAGSMIEVKMASTVPNKSQRV